MICFSTLSSGLQVLTPLGPVQTTSLRAVLIADLTRYNDIDEHKKAFAVSIGSSEGKHRFA